MFTSVRVVSSTLSLSSSLLALLTAPLWGIDTCILDILIGSLWFLRGSNWFKDDSKLDFLENSIRYWTVEDRPKIDFLQYTKINYFFFLGRPPF